MRSDATVKQVIELADTGSCTSGPPTALRMQGAKTPSGRGEIGAIELMYDYDEDYERKLNDHSDSTLDKTSLWLTAQESYLATLRSDDTADAPTTPPPTKEAFSREASPKSIISPAKSVRFAVESPEDSEKQSPRKSPKESTFVRGFKYIRESSTDSDVFVHRKERIEALDLDRRHLSDKHRKQLLGKYELGSPTRTSPKRPISEFLPHDVEDTEQKAILGKAQKERSALLQIKPVSWNLEATKLLNGGTLLTSPAGKAMFHLEEPQVLDLGGQASCDWAWEVALQHCNATVYTAYTADQAPSADIERPANHKSTLVPNLWTLPFPNNHFDVVSARSLFMFLKTDKPTGRAVDEYDLCLRECLRCLKPGGYLEFALLDADILRAGRQASALSVEFGFNLKTRGYDSQPTKAFLPRLRKAGYGQVRRAWVILPMARPTSAADGSTTDASYITGLIGAWLWERWMLKLHTEMGKEEERCLDGVTAALEEGAQIGAAWRYLSGWARKP